VNYDWKRFWCPREDHYLITDEGYLSDPKSEHAKALTPNVKTLDQFSRHACIVLLGEPGIGKSTEFNQEFERQAHSCRETNDPCLKFNLNEYQTDTLLVSDIFDGVEQNAWKHGQGNLYLFLDSLDEGRIQIKTIANLLSGRLLRLSSQLKRLKIRIACRTAEWPTSLASTLTELWPGDEAKFLELTPLRFVDITTAAQVQNVDVTQFISEVSRLDAHSFANRPISLKFLISAFKKDGALPRSKFDLYKVGCFTLCDEFNQSRRENPGSSQLSSLERYTVASRIASIVEFCGKGTISLAPQNEQGAGEIAVARIAGGFESIEGRQLAVTEEVVKEVLATTLFTGRGPERLAFAHKTYSEFLAAQYIVLKGIDETQIRSLIFHSSHQASIVPQLSEIGGWISIQKPTIFEQIFVGDPQILLRSDVPTDDGLRARLIDRLIQGFRTGELDDSNWALRAHYRKLKHAQVAEQLAPIISDPGQSLLTRRFIDTPR